MLNTCCSCCVAAVYAFRALLSRSEEVSYVVVTVATGVNLVVAVVVVKYDIVVADLYIRL